MCSTLTKILLIHLLFILLVNLGNAQYLSSPKSNNPNDGDSENSADSNPDFVIIGLPDTQYYSEDDGHGQIETFIAQTDWIVQNRAAKNIVYVAHLGDCVENADDSTEWIRAVDAMDNLEDPATTTLSDGIPYGIAVGNHDQFDEGSAVVEDSTTKLYNKYFGFTRFSGRDYYGGHYSGDNDNHFDKFEVGTLKFVVVYIEYNAHLDEPAALDWADSILAANADRHGILVSHKLLSSNGQFGDDADSIYSRVRDNANLFLMLCGHNTSKNSESRLIKTRGGDSTDVVTLMSNYQHFANGGDGWLRIMKFSPVDSKIYVKTYSPTRVAFRTGSDSEFDLDFSFPDLPLPVELTFFAGALNGNNVELRWRTETELNNYGFDIEYATDNSDWLAIGFVEGHGNSNSPKLYNFIDPDINQTGTYNYRLKQIDNDGTYEYSDVVSVEVGIPSNFYLSQNYPNPFNPETRIDFTLPEKQLISLRIYNTLGEIIVELVNEEREAGSYSVTFNASNLPSGVYIYRLQTSSFAANKKMTLIK